MTIVASWVRKIRDAEELVLVSDSRVSGDSRYFDAAPKILALPRNDCAIAFAGFTGHAFPMMLQLELAIASYRPLLNGELELTTVKSHALKIFDSMSNLITRDPRIHGIGETLSPDAQFVFAGYSWIKKTFQIWSIVFQQAERRFIAKSVGSVGYSAKSGTIHYHGVASSRKLKFASQVVFAGDQAADARRRLLARLKQKYPDGSGFTVLDWEPFEVIRDMLREPNHAPTIGGAPQIVKVYQYLQVDSLAVYWPRKENGVIFLQGRPCLGYENIDAWVLDPDKLVTHRQAQPGGNELNTLAEVSDGEGI